MPNPMADYGWNFVSVSDGYVPPGDIRNFLEKMSLGRIIKAIHVLHLGRYVRSLRCLSLWKLPNTTNIKV